MTKTQRIASISHKLARVRVDDLAHIEDVVESFAEPVPSPYPFTKRDLDLIAQSKEDFRLGRTYTWEESKKRSAAFMERMHKKYAKKV